MVCMSDESRGSAGSGKGYGISRRVGTTERQDSIARLDAHWQAGRLDPGEHELRVTRAKTAVTQADLDVLFFDLPRGARGFLESGRETIMALTPFAALALLFTTGQWLWFLMIPVMGILLYGPEGRRKAGRRRPRGRYRGC
jgi:hypothetical protein